MWKGLFCAKMAASAMMVDAIERTPKGNHTMSTVAQILSSKPSQAVHTVPPGASVREAIELMARQRIGSLLIVDGARILGIFTERDYAQKVEVRGRTSTGTPISEVMTPDVIFVTPATTSQECMALMTGRRLRHLPVMDQGTLVGLISIGDVVKARLEEAAHEAAKAFDEMRGTDETRCELIGEVFAAAEADGFDKNQIAVTVRWFEKCARKGVELMRAGEAVFHRYRGTIDAHNAGEAAAGEPVSADPKLAAMFAAKPPAKPSRRTKSAMDAAALARAARQAGE